MKRYLNPLILMLALFLLLGSLPAEAVERPFGSSGAGNLTFLTDGAGNVIGATLTASGMATHLGLWTAAGEISFFPPDPAHPNLIPASGTQTFTVANGDELDAVFTDAVLDTTTGIGTGVFLFVGGTGRFEEASGSADFVVMQDPSGPFEVTTIGTIDF